MKRTLILTFLLISTQSTWAIDVQARDLWQIKLQHETKRLTDSPIYLFTTVDLNRNGSKEIVIADFGLFQDAHEWSQRFGPKNIYNLVVLEWKTNEFKEVWRKTWDKSKARNSIESSKYYSFWKSKRLLAWSTDGKTVVETVPPYLGLEWNEKQYILHEQYGPYSDSQVVGSWAFPWLGASCFFGFTNFPSYPRECLIGIRDFSGRGKPKIVTLLEDKEKEKKKHKFTLRVRAFEKGFPVEWEQRQEKEFVTYPAIDKYNMRLKSALRLMEKSTGTYYLFDRGSGEKDYRLREVKVKEKIDEHSGPMGITSSWYWDIHIGATRKKELEEYWGWHRTKGPDEGYIESLRRVIIKRDLSAFLQYDLEIPHHEPFLGVGYFNLADMDGDGIDEVILIEQTGKRSFDPDSIAYRDTKDYIRILKWNGKKYQTMWISPPYTKRGTKFLVEDIKGTSKKQLVVLSPYGTVQVWERY